MRTTAHLIAHATCTKGVAATDYGLARSCCYRMVTPPSPRASVQVTRCRMSRQSAPFGVAPARAHTGSAWKGRGRRMDSEEAEAASEE